MYKLVLVRHGQSSWNKANRFTGWMDVGLTLKGEAEAKSAGKILKQKKYTFDYAYTSLLKRAIRTLNIISKQMGLKKIPVTKDWRLNERHYGNLIGLNKAETLKKFGEKQYMLWRRGYATRPPRMNNNNPYYKTINNDSRYKNIKVPLTECLKDVVARVVPYWNKEIAPQIKSGKKIIISASGNSLRALIKYLDKISDKDIMGLDLPTGVPLVYELDKNLKPIRHYYLGDKKKIAAAIAAVKNQGKNK
jgi:2,3-bisphosphoglycerate-dependent phosphoglycerate mutase